MFARMTPIALREKSCVFSGKDVHICCGLILRAEHPVALGGKKKTNPDKPLSEQKNWYADRYQSALVQRNILAAVTMVALLATLFSAISVSQLTPLKSVQPFVVQIDDKTGVTKVVDPLKQKEISADRSLKEYFVAQYIRARENYDPVNYKDYFYTVRVMSDKNIYKDYREYMLPANPQSPVTLFGRHSQRRVDILSMNFVNENSAQVRIRSSYGGAAKDELNMEPKIYIIYISFEFVKLDLNAEERYINPVGFQVTNYVIDEELTPQ